MQPIEKECSRVCICEKPPIRHLLLDLDIVESSLSILDSGGVQY